MNKEIKRDVTGSGTTRFFMGKKYFLRGPVFEVKALWNRLRMVYIDKKGITIKKKNDTVVIFSGMWDCLTKFSNTENTAYLQFENSGIKLDFRESNEILISIKRIISQISPIHVLSESGLDFLPTNMGGYHLLKIKYPSLLPTYENLLLYQKQDVSIIDPEYSNILKIIPYLPSFKKLKISVSFEQILAELFIFLTLPSCIEEIILVGSLGDKIPEFFRLIENNPNSKIQAISFLESSLSLQDLKLLGNSAKKRKIHSFSFHNAIFGSYRTFFDPFLMTFIGDSLNYLDMSNTNGLDIRGLIPCISNIMFLKLRNCNIDIASLLHMISKHLKRICILDICENEMKTHINDDIVLPETIFTVFADNMRWKSNIMSFLKCIFSQFKLGLRLTLSNASLSESEWFEVFSFLESSSFFSLVSLKWDYNPINNSFFSFLLRNPLLSSLSLSYCFPFNQISSLNSFIDYLGRKPSIQMLLCKGNGDNYLGRSLSLVIENLASIQSLEIVDFSYNKSGDSSFDHIKSFVLNHNIRVCNFDGQFPTSKDLYFEFLRSITKFRYNVLSFPENDLKYLLFLSAINSKEFEGIKLKFLEPTNTNSFVSPFDKPFNIYKEDFEFEIPNILTDHYLKKLKSKSQFSFFPSINNIIEQISPQKLLSINEKSNNQHSSTTSLSIKRKGTRQIKILFEPEKFNNPQQITINKRSSSVSKSSKTSLTICETNRFQRNNSDNVGISWVIPDYGNTQRINQWEKAENEFSFEYLVENIRKLPLEKSDSKPNYLNTIEIP